MSNTVITNYTDLNGPSTKADSSVVVIVNKDGSVSVDQNLLDTLMGTDGSQAAGISVVRVGHEGRPDDATDSETEDDKIPHVTLSVDSYYDEPNSIIKYDSGADMLQSLRIETRENSLVGFQNDHCYTSLTSPSQGEPLKSDNYSGFDEPIIEITHTPPPKPVPISKKITILDQQIIPKGKKLPVKSSEPSVVLKGIDVLNKPLPVISKSKLSTRTELSQKSDENESSSVSSGDSIPDRDSDSDYKEVRDKNSIKPFKKSKGKPRILKAGHGSKPPKLDPRVESRLKSGKSLIRKVMKEKNQTKTHLPVRKPSLDTSVKEISEDCKTTPKQAQKPVKKEKKTPAHVSALLSDMTSLFSTPDVIRRVSTDGKPQAKSDKESLKSSDSHNKIENKTEQDRRTGSITKTYIKSKEKAISEKVSKGYDLIPQLDDASLAQILQDTSTLAPSSVKSQAIMSIANNLGSPGLAGPLSPTLDLLGGLQPEEEGLTEDLLMHVAQLVESSDNLKEVIDKQVLGKVDTGPPKTIMQTPFQQAQVPINVYQPSSKTVKTTVPRKDPIEIVRRDGRVITLPPIEAPATRSSKRKFQMESPAPTFSAPIPSSTPVPPSSVTPEPQVQPVSKQYVNKKKPEPQLFDSPIEDKISAESQESWNSEDDPNRLWCICKQPHNNRFMICCDGCEDWFHGKCVNITKAMGQQMEEQGIEWRCPNCVKKAKGTPAPKVLNKLASQKKSERSLNRAPPGSSRAAIGSGVGPGTGAGAGPIASTSNGVSPVKSVPGGVGASPASPGSGACIVCTRPARAASIYCSPACILQHARDSLERAEPADPHSSSADCRVIVYERKSGRLLAGPNAPTAENLKSWLQKNPTFEVVRPGTLSTIKPKLVKKKPPQETNKVQTTLNFEKIPRRSIDTPIALKSPEPKDSVPKTVTTPKEEKILSVPRTPVTPRSQHQQSILQDTPKASTSKAVNEPKKIGRATTSRSQSSFEKTPSVSPATPRRKDTPDIRRKMSSTDPIRDNVRKALQEQLSIRMSETSGQKFTESEIQQFAIDTETELHELFRDVGMKYKAKYRSLMFNIKDRKNLSLWQKICDRSITPKQLVRLSPEELASQELAQWRDKEAKHQLELIKKSELDLLAASKTYVLKTHKGEEVMETKESVSTELDPNVSVEDLVTALNDSTTGADTSTEISNKDPTSTEKKHIGKKKEKESRSGHSKRDKESKREIESRKSRSSRRSLTKEKEKEEARRSLADSTASEHTRSTRRRRSRSRPRSRSRSRPHSRSRSRHRSHSRSHSHTRTRTRRRDRETERRRNRSRSKHRPSKDDDNKNRSKSQDAACKNNSPEADLVERPKSAMTKEVHPEYDPHEPMITSAHSEEDIRKSKDDDVFENTYKNELADYEDAYNPAKVFSIDAMPMPSGKVTEKKDKLSEGESDQEPSSTVENSAVTVWNGCINMVDVARFYVAAHEVSGSSTDLEEDLSAELDVVGRINPDTVWEYIGKMKKAVNKDIIVLKLQAANDEEKMQYIALYSYLSSRNRLGVVKVTNTNTVKDFYIVPLAANSTLPPVLYPLDGPGLGEGKNHLLIAIVIRQKNKRLTSHMPTDTIPAKVRKRSYTPPTRRRLPLPSYSSPALTSTVKDKIAASLAGSEEVFSADAGGSSGPAPLRSKMEELNRQIEEQKQQIRSMTRARPNDEEEAYSPSRPVSPGEVGGEAAGEGDALAHIALPSNLQEILANIKKRSEPSADVDMRTLPLP